jgi:hypothetical protein
VQPTYEVDQWFLGTLNNVGGVLEFAASPTSGFTPVAGATTSPYRAAATEAQRFFRARR